MTDHQLARSTAEKIRAIDSTEIYSESCTLPDLILASYHERDRAANKFTEKEAETIAGNFKSMFAYDDKLKAMTPKELILEVLGSTAADYRCVNELMNRVLPNFANVLTDEETEAAMPDSPEKFSPLVLADRAATAMGGETDTARLDKLNRYFWQGKTFRHLGLSPTLTKFSLLRARPQNTPGEYVDSQGRTLRELADNLKELPNE